MKHKHDKEFGPLKIPKHLEHILPSEITLKFPSEITSNSTRASTLESKYKFIQREFEKKYHDIFTILNFNGTDPICTAVY